MQRRPSPTDTPTLDARLLAAFRRRILTWFEVNHRDLPWRRTRDPYAVLVSEVMLQQTQVVRVVPRYEEWLKELPALEALAAASLADVLRLWQGLGYNNRARRLRDCATATVAAPRPEGAAVLPRSLDELQALPGIGPYTARAVLIFAHNDDLAAVDANVRRVLTHGLGLDEQLSDRELQAVADVVLPPGRSRDWHNALMDYGALVLTARATGIAPRTRQGAFQGSRRQHRARLLRLLLGRGPQSIDQLASALSLEPAVTRELVGLLRTDGLVTCRDDIVAVA
jgi:A/G-specific adenine glycosylase